MNQAVSLAVGTDLLDFAPSFHHVGGIRVDNPSAAWLLVQGSYYVPPYTFQWATPLLPKSLSISVRFLSQGPGGQPSSLTGSPVTVYIDSEILAYSRGQTYLSNP